ncbi:MAG TPA: hypothetical protein VIL71_15335 [Spirillospora sp.]
MRDDAGRLAPVRRSDDPERWREQVEADAPVVTRVEPGPSLPGGLCDPETGEGMVSTRSSGAPFIMARLLEVMELKPGTRVLEIEPDPLVALRRVRGGGGPGAFPTR